jgi:hypothetical protein
MIWSWTTRTIVTNTVIIIMRRGPCPLHTEVGEGMRLRIGLTVKLLKLSKPLTCAAPLAGLLAAGARFVAA